HPGLHMTFWYGTLVYGAIFYAALVWRIVLWLRYRPMESVADEELPSVSVIIPAYNEGRLVRQSIRSVADNDYPAGKLQIIVVDDGSTDTTWRHIQAAVRQVQSRRDALALRQPRNMGKRAALNRGFQSATGDVIVTMDSDSIFARDTLRHAVTPLVRDPRVGCVAGCVEVLNPYDSIWTRILKCTFTLSFKFVRAYQNQFRGVFFSPGALSVYRADVLHRVADEWMNQHFLGLPCKTGEDRALTNLFLRKGWLTAYQQNARVWAKMPDTYGGVCNMFLRWARSNIRETLFLLLFMFTPFRRDHLGAFRLNMILTISTLVIPYLLIANSFALIVLHPVLLLRHLSFVVVYGLTQCAIYYRMSRDSDWLWLMLYSIFWVIGLAWIMPYAAMSLRNTGWLTRGQPAPRPRPSTRTPASTEPASLIGVGAPVPDALSPATASLAVMHRSA
ncbi:MAG: glycosyltransferase, partial [Phycisphaerae bacterium]